MLSWYDFLRAFFSENAVHNDTHFLPHFSIIVRTVGIGTRESNKKNEK